MRKMQSLRRSGRWGLEMAGVWLVVIGARALLLAQLLGWLQVLPLADLH